MIWLLKRFRPKIGPKICFYDSLYGIFVNAFDRPKSVGQAISKANDEGLKSVRRRLCIFSRVAIPLFALYELCVFLPWCQCTSNLDFPAGLDRCWCGLHSSMGQAHSGSCIMGTWRSGLGDHILAGVFPIVCFFNSRYG